MKISTNWLNDYIAIENVDLKELADKITKVGVAVETISEGIDFSHLIVGEVIECELHPNSDHLHVCTVNIGTEVLQIVCGAPNVKKGIKVIVALVGAILPGNFEIKKSTIRGVDSNGMLCALSELGFEDKIEGGIHELPVSAVVGEQPKKYISNDVVYELDLNPNRNDCLSILGFAYEAAAVLNQKVKLPNNKYEEIDKDINDIFKLKVETPNCSFFSCKYISDIKIKESPEYIKERLINSGMRPINNIVDISNYIMLEYGQPLHFYDADKLNSVIGVREANDNEIIKALNSEEYTLSKDDLVITSDTKIAGIAGVMGGYDTEVDENTKNILIESAIFNPLMIRKTSIKLGLRSEASLRFEKGLNYEYTLNALDRACSLVFEYGDGKVYSGMLLYDKEDKKPKKASISLERINKYLGITLKDRDVKSAFDRLGFEYSAEYDVIIPRRRMDVSISEDLIEEVGRIYGFEHINGTYPKLILKKGKFDPRILYRKDISAYLKKLGLDEVKTYTLTDEKNIEMFNYDNVSTIKVNNPMSIEKEYLRTSLIPSLLDVCEYNKYRSVENVNIYEISNVYESIDNEYKETMKLCISMHGSILNNPVLGINIKVDFYLLKGMIENLLHYLGFDKRYSFISNDKLSFMHPGVTANIVINNKIVGFLGKTNPNLKMKDVYVCEINLDLIRNIGIGKVKYKEPNKYPFSIKDLCFVVDKNLNGIDLVNEIKKIEPHIISSCEIFDVYDMGDKKSIALKMKFESFDHTLGEDEINVSFNKIIDTICKKFNAILKTK